MTSNNQIFLLDIVEVAHNRRIRCQADGCGHSVFAKIHVVLDHGAFIVLGSDCFQKLYGKSLGDAKTYFGGSKNSPRHLDENLSQLLETNTAEFIARLEAKRLQIEAEIAERSRREAQLAKSARVKFNVGTLPGLSSAMSEAKHRLSKQYPGIDLNAAGWTGLVRREAEKILAERRVEDIDDINE